MQAPTPNTINYIEIACRNLIASKVFFTNTFGWEFTDYGPEYTSFFDGVVTGGFYQADLAMQTNKGSALIVIYQPDLPASLDAIRKHGGSISKDIFAFPGGHRFHFNDPSGNEYAVWSDQHA